MKINNHLCFWVVLEFLFVQLEIRFCHMDPRAHLGRLIGFVFLAIAHVHWTHGPETCKVKCLELTHLFALAITYSENTNSFIFALFILSKCSIPRFFFSIFPTKQGRSSMSRHISHLFFLVTITSSNHY